MGLPPPLAVEDAVVSFASDCPPALRVCAVKDKGKGIVAERRVPAGTVLFVDAAVVADQLPEQLVPGPGRVVACAHTLTPLDSPAEMLRRRDGAVRRSSTHHLAGDISTPAAAGLTICPLSNRLESVAPGSAAEKAGCRKAVGAVLVGVGGAPVGSLSDLARAWKAAAGAPLEQGPGAGLSMGQWLSSDSRLFTVTAGGAVRAPNWTTAMKRSPDGKAVVGGTTLLDSDVHTVRWRKRSGDTFTWHRCATVEFVHPPRVHGGVIGGGAVLHEGIAAPQWEALCTPPPSRRVPCRASAGGCRAVFRDADTRDKAWSEWHSAVCPGAMRPGALQAAMRWEDEEWRLGTGNQRLAMRMLLRVFAGLASGAASPWQRLRALSGEPLPPVPLAVGHCARVSKEAVWRRGVSIAARDLVGVVVRQTAEDTDLAVQMWLHTDVLTALGSNRYRAAPLEQMREWARTAEDGVDTVEVAAGQTVSAIEADDGFADATVVRTWRSADVQDMRGAIFHAAAELLTDIIGPGIAEPHTVEHVLALIMQNSFFHRTHVDCFGPVAERSAPADAAVHARALFGLTSCLNHSCEPNAAAVRGRPTPADRPPDTVAVVSSRDMAEGDEVTISYLADDGLRMGVDERRRLLMMQYAFRCCCSRCRRESE